MTSAPSPLPSPTAPTQIASPRCLPLLLLLFVGSGCAALIYEIVWFQLLQLVIGSTGVSLGILLATFMGGMCLGSLLLPRCVSAARHPMRVYALLEAGIGGLGILVLLGVPHVGGLYAAAVAPGLMGILLRGLTCAVCLLPPTLLMGATLPAVARWVRATPQGVSWLGFFYGGNIAGAVFGCLLAGFYLLRVHDMATATWVAAAVNGAVALIACALSLGAAHAPGPRATEPESDAPRGARTIYLAIALSGMTALGAEVVWTRLLSLLLGATVYTFSIILAVVLLGLGIGSAGGAWFARPARRPRAALGWAQLLLPLAIGWTAYMLTQSLPYWPTDPYKSTDPWIDFQFDLVRSIWALLPATILWGASFPLALASVASPGQDPGRVVGSVYAANTLGAILGALLFSMVIIPVLGSQQAQRVLIGLAVVAGLLALFPSLAAPGERGLRVLLVGPLAIGVVALDVAIARAVTPIPPGLIAYGRVLPSYPMLPDFLYVGEGMNSCVAVADFPGGYRSFHVSGKIEASTEPQDMRVQRLLGHLPALIHRRPKTVLVVGFGSGMTAGSFVLYPEVERIVICELEPLIPPNVGPCFRKENNDVIEDKRVEIVYDDARHFILTTKEKFDVITSDPIHPWVKGAAMLYTREYLDLVRAHLNPGGVAAQWVPLYESHADTVKSEMATFLESFPWGTVWANNVKKRGYDVVMIGQPEPTQIDIEALHRRMGGPSYARVMASLKEVGISSTLDLFGGYTGGRADLAPWLHDAQINRDRNLRLQYLAGLGKSVRVYEREEMYIELTQDLQFPESLFLADQAWKDALAKAIGRPQAPAGH